jgi:hypothetical protein
LFGSRWAHDSITAFAFGILDSNFVVEQIVLPDIHDAGQIYDPNGRPVDYHTTSLGHRFTAYGFRTALSLRSPHTLFALEYGFVLGRPPALQTDTDGMTVTGGDTALGLDVALVAGVHERVGPLDAGVELAPGYRHVDLYPALPDGYRGCAPDVTRCGEPDLTVNMVIVDVRARADWWVTRQVTLGLVGGVDLVHHGLSAMVAFRFHLAVYDGG